MKMFLKGLDGAIEVDVVEAVHVDGEIYERIITTKHQSWVGYVTGDTLSIYRHRVEIKGPYQVIDEDGFDLYPDCTSGTTVDLPRGVILSNCRVKRRYNRAS